ncbi:MAG: MBG domain-containing protein, partial [Pseudoflavonifractor sp.]
DLGTAAPRNAGNYTLVITGSDDAYAGSLTLPFSIDKRPLTVTAVDKFVVFGAAPEFTFTSNGLVTNETLTGVTYTCAYDKDKLDPGIARTAIIPRGGTVSRGNDNYAITYVPGTLTINPDNNALTAAIKAAEALKSGVEISDKTPDEETYGKRFVTSEVMKSLENAIAVAKQVVGIALAPQEIADAMTALTSATDAFKSAIQTGTYGSDSVTRYAITATAGEGGSISPEGTVRIQRGKDKAFTITPNEGYVIADVLVDGTSVGTVSTYTFSKVTKAHTISATFRLWTNPYSDVKKQDWFYEAVQSVTQRGLMTGVSENHFNPYGTATRGTIITVLYRQAGSPSVETKETKWYSSAQAWGIKTGISDGANMDRSITRQELVTMLHRYAKQMKMDVSVGEDTNILSYNDAFELPPWSIPAFQWA